MAEVTIRLEGLDAVIDKVKALNAADISKAALSRFSEEVKLKAIPYPPEGPWNMPDGRWYQRHFGPRWRTKDGHIAGKNTSEILQKQWFTAVKNVWSAVVGNRASYADKVVGPGQEMIHKQHGWKTLESIVVENLGLWREFLKQEIEKRVGR